MKRMHIHVGVDDLDHGIRFYSALFGTSPARIERDYARWILEDPRINFAISTRARTKGVDHLGLQVDDSDELDEIRARLTDADLATFGTGETVCCYARSEKSWVRDPSGVPWEAYRTMADAQVFSEGGEPGQPACCTPVSGSGAACCAPEDTDAGAESPDLV